MTAIVGLSVSLGWLGYEAWQSLLWLAEVEELRREAHE